MSALGRGPASGQTCEMLFQKWLPWRASTHHWKGKTVSTNWCLVNNYILPVFGSRKVRQLTTMDMDMYLQKIGSMFTAQSVRIGNPEKISSSTMHTIYTLIKGALDKAQVWGFISQNPMAGAMGAPKVTQKERPIWDEDEAWKLLQQADTPLLHLAIHLAYICSLRNGETVGITLDCINLKNNRLLINKTLAREERVALAMGDEKILFTFPTRLKTRVPKSMLVLKEPKDQSQRIAFPTRPLMEEIRERIRQIEENKQRLGEEYHDYNLLLCQDNGDPIEPKLLDNWFKRYLSSLPGGARDYVFHCLRHSATTYKLELSDGDIKSVQGENGHRTAAMTVDHYSRIRLKSREELSRKVEEDFYRQERPEKKAKTGMLETDAIVNMLKDNSGVRNAVLLALLAPNAQDA